MQTRETQSWLDCLARRDAGAWRILIDRYDALVGAIGRCAGLQACEVDDLRQEVWGSLWRRLPTFSLDSSRGRFCDYLRVTTKNAVRRMLRQRERHLVEIGLLTMEPRDEFDPVVEIEARESRSHTLERALVLARRQFDDRTVNVFVVLLEGSSIEECARLFSLRPNTVYKIRRRVCDRLREDLRDD
ncbi:MAG: sigma-70 family RNA polymerase sigma factor [Planctomycetes bacterium]|nr:sigma-70 family RNA polymerase sigma factor [Planctomycetota bacterium]